MKLFKKIKSMFIKENIEYNYSYIKSISKVLDFYLPDIVSYNKNLKLLLNNNNFLEDAEYQHVIKISAETHKRLELLYWCTNGNKKLDDLNKEVQTFLSLSKEVITKFNTMKVIKQNDNLFKFNIRTLQPYIINLENIRKELEMK